VASLTMCLRRAKYLKKIGTTQLATDGHGCTRIPLSSYLVDTTLVLLCYKILSRLKTKVLLGIV
jgi:hypothetical protein